MANNDTWNIDPSDREFLTRQGATEREAILAAGLVDGVPPWRIGEIASYGAGRSSDLEKRRQNWSAAVSRAAKRGGQVVARIQVLIDALKHFRTNGEAPKLATESEVLEKLSNVIRGSNDATVISAARALLESYRRDRVQKHLTAKQYIKAWVARVGPERTKRGLEEFDAGHLVYTAPELFEDHDARLEQELLEDGNEQSRPVARCAGDDSRNFDSGGSRRVGGDAPREVDREPENAGGVGAGQRRDGSRDVKRRLSELEKLELEARL